MTVESTIFDTLKTLVSNRVFPDVAPANATRPYITYQRVGGEAINFLDPTVPNKKRSRFQINVWGDTRKSVALIAGQVEDALRVVASLQTTVEGAPVSLYEADTGLKGSLQDFSFIN